MATSTKRGRFARQVPRAVKARSGRTPAHATPLNVRPTGVRLDPATRAWIEARAGRQLGKFATHIERLTVRFTDVNGARGGRDMLCRAKVVLSGLPSVVVQEQAHAPREAFDLAAASLRRAVRKSIDRGRSVVADRAERSLSAKRGAAPPKRKRAAPSPVQVTNPEGSLIGRRVGRSHENLSRAAERPEKTRRDVPVDTSMLNVSASDRKVGARSTAVRNTKLNRAGMVATLEDSATGKPSRKPTRRSHNRARSGDKLQRKALRKLQRPQAKARRAAARAV